MSGRRYADGLTPQQRYQARKKAAGICRFCTRPRKPGRTRCQECTDDAVARIRAKEFGISRDEWTRMWNAQGRACLICLRSSGTYKWCTDHDHKTGAVRGILCTKCNYALGFLDDDPEVAARAAAYLGGSLAAQTVGIGATDAIRQVMQQDPDTAPFLIIQHSKRAA